MMIMLLPSQSFIQATSVPVPSVPSGIFPKSMRIKPEFQNTSTAMWIQKLLDVETEVFREQPQSHSSKGLKNTGTCQNLTLSK
jgi:hypothetical protein